MLKLDPNRVRAPVVGGRRLVVEGAVLRARGAKRRWVFGVMADPREASGPVLDAVARQAGILVHRGALALVLLGGIDPTFEGTRNILGVLDAVAPVFALPGDQVSRSGFRAAVENAGPNVVDMTLVRAVVLPGATLVAVPGYHLPLFTAAKDQSCGYDRADLDAVAELVDTLPGPRVLLAHGPPRGSGETAVDRAFGRINVGDPRLSRWMGAAGVTFGLFGHVAEAVGHATDMAGSPVAAGQLSPSLLLNVGSVDAIPHQRLDGSWVGSTAALVEIVGGKARYTLVTEPRRTGRPN